MLLFFKIPLWWRPSWFLFGIGRLSDKLNGWKRGGWLVRRWRQTAPLRSGRGGWGKPEKWKGGVVHHGGKPLSETFLVRFTDKAVQLWVREVVRHGGRGGDNFFRSPFGTHGGSDLTFICYVLLYNNSISNRAAPTKFQHFTHIFKQWAPISDHL